MHAHASLNRIYRLVWSALHQTWVVASELTRGRGKSSATPLLSAALLATLAAISSGVGAVPQGGQVVSGSGSISASGGTGQGTTTINQASDKPSLNWQSFNVAKTETVNFLQPSASALAVNRIFDTQGSQILGRINANGQVWLINPNGVIFGRDAQINVGGLLASTLNPDDASIGSARSNFSGSSTAGVVDLGTINTAQGGYVALLGHSVSNQGSISAPGGSVALGAGSAVSLNFAGSKLLGLEVTSNQVNALAENGGLIQADGGQVLLSAGARDSLLASVVNNTGVIQARTVQEQEGKIVLLGGMAAGTTNVGGTLDASAPSGGDGGFSETSAHTVNVADSANITTASANGSQGQWLIDPYDFYVASSGGNITGAALGSALNSNNVTIQTVASANPTVTGATAGGTYTSGLGDIFVNDAIAWASTKTLTLNTYRNININSAITASAGGLTLTAGSGGSISAPASVAVGTFNLISGTWRQIASSLPNFSATSFQINDVTFIRALGGSGSAANPYQIADVYGLQGIGRNSETQAYHYALANDIAAGGTASWNLISGTYRGFAPIVTFTGTFDGLGRTITGLTMNRVQSLDNFGLFREMGINGIVKNVGLVNASITGKNNVGGLVGSNTGTIINSYVTGSVSGNTSVGGLVGYNNGGSISSSYATARVTATGKVASGQDAGKTFVGGLLGRMLNGVLSDSHATGMVTGTGNDVGGLVGANDGGAVSGSYATGSVSGVNNVGGLVGRMLNGTLSSVYATGNVTGSASNVGGLVGANDGAVLSSSYATGNVSGVDNVGGLVGSNTGTISSSYATGPISGVNGVGGLVGYNDLLGTISSSYAETPGTDGGSFNIGGSSNIGGLVGNNLGTIDNSYATPSVTGIGQIGGLAGSNSGIIRSSYATGNVGGSTIVGGLVGNNTGTISTSYAKGNVTGTDGGESTYFGGLVGQNNGGTISSSYATGSASGSYAIGGLVGLNAGTIDSSYATGSVTASGLDPDGNTYVGGLVGQNDNGSISSSYFDMGTTGQTDGVGSGDASGVMGLTSAQMKQSSNFSDFDFSNTWFNYDGYTNPLLRTFLTALNVSYSISGSRTYDGTTACGTITCSYTTGTLTGGKSLLGSVVLSTKNVGTATGTGLYSDQQGYLISADTAGTATITRKTLTVSGITAADKTYNGTTTATVSTTGANYDGLVSGDALTVSASGTFANKNAGTAKTVTLSSSYSGADVGNYSITDQSSTTASITPKALTISGTTAAGKTYNGNTATTLSLGTLSGFVANETVSATASGTFDSKNAGSRTATAVYSLVDGTNGGLASNYSLANTTHSATIAKKALSVTGTSVANKTYDGNTIAAITVGTLSGFVNSETVSATANGTFGNKNAGVRAATAAYTLVNGTNGELATNYSLANTTGLSASIAKAPLTITGNSASTTYSGIAQSVSGYSASGLVGSDTTSSLSGVNASGASGTNAGSYTNTVTAATQANYTVTTASGTLTIDKKALSISGTSAADKTYDGNTTAAVTMGTLSGFVNGETVSATANGTFDSKNAGTRTVTANYTLTNGTGWASNYTLADTTHIATIDKANLTQVTASKAYDGMSTVTAAQMGVIRGVNGESFTASDGTAEISDKNVAAANKKLTDLSGLTLDSQNGGEASNYNLDSGLPNAGTNNAVDITRASLTASLAAQTKTYNGNNIASWASGTIIASGFADDEGASVTKTSGTYNSKNVVGASSVSATLEDTDFSFNSGVLVSNYVLPTSVTATGSTITPKTLSASLAAQTKTYNGNNTASWASGTIIASGFIDGENATVTKTSGTHNSKNVVGASSVTASLASTDFNFNSQVLASNYVLPTSVTATGSTITRKTLSVSLGAQTKTNDGNSTASWASGTIIASGFIDGENATVTKRSGTYDDKNAGVASSVTASLNSNNLSFTGGGVATNYVLPASVSAAGSITKANLTQVTANKTYDGLSTVTAQEIGVIKGVNGESFTASDGTATISNKNVAAANKTLTDLSGLTLTGAGGGNTSNYNLASGLPAAGTNNAVTVTAKSLSVSLAAQTKTYDGNDTATWASGTITASGFASGEGASVTQTSGTYNDKNVVSASSVTAELASTDFSFNSGVLASNYVLPTSVTATGSTITPANLTQVTASKTYDGLSTVTAAQMGVIIGVNGESFTASDGTAAISNKNVATANKTLTDLSGLTLDGQNGGEASNYKLNSGLPDVGSNNAVTITAKTATVSGTLTNTTYNGLTQTQTAATTSGFLEGDTIIVSGLASGKNANSYASDLAVGGTDASNYSVTINNANLVIAKANATVTANSNTALTYNGANQTVSGFSASGLQGSESASVLTGVSASTSYKNAGSYTTSASGSDANYNLSFVDGSMVIAKANATVTANSNTALTYNGANQTVSGFSASGLQGSESASVLTGVSASTSYKNAGSYTTSASGSDANYNLSFVDGSMVIAKANLIYTASPATLNTGAAPKDLSGMVSGFVNNETQGEATTGTLAWITPATNASSAGRYAIYGSGLSAVNYSFSQAETNLTSLTLTQAVLLVPTISTITFNTPFSITNLLTSAQAAQTNQSVNTLPPTGAGNEQATSDVSGLDEDAEVNPIQNLGQTGLIYATGDGVKMPKIYYQPAQAGAIQNP